MKARHLVWAIGCATAIAAAPAWAEYKFTFNFSSGTNCLGANATSACNFGNTRNASSVTGSPNPIPAKTSVTAQAWSNTKGGTVQNPSSGPLETAYLPAWDGNGLGVQNRDMANYPTPVPAGLGDHGDGIEGTSPEHAVDNNQRYDSILFSFGGDGIKLTGVEIGYSSNDSDIFVLAYTGNAPLALGGLNYSDLTSNGWQLIGNYSNLATNTKKTVNAGGVTANYWLVGTGCYTGTGSGVSNCDGKQDFVKVLAVYGEAGKHDHKVPEPSSAFLMLGALAGFWRVGRRKGADGTKST
jgi:PEP-CTERM motif